MIRRLHHTAIIVSSEESVAFYKAIGFEEEKRIDRGYDVVVWLNGFGESLELFVDGTHPERVSYPEALGLRHIAFEVVDAEKEWKRMQAYHPEPIRMFDNGRRLFFVKDPDGLPIEFREA